MRASRRERLVNFVDLLRDGPKSYREIGRGLRLTSSQVDGDRVALQRAGVVDVTGPDFHTVVLLRNVDRSEIEVAFPSRKSGRGDAWKDIEILFEGVK